LKDLNGRRIIARRYEKVNKNAVKVETPSLSPGIYLIRVQGTGKTWLRKHLIQ
jgi:hypothetical protein